jgi:hypothetical protein
MMPIRYQIEHEHRLVRAVITGTLTREDTFSYQREVWSRPDVRGYNQLVDASALDHVDIPFPSADAMRELAALAASMDDPDVKSRFAIVATSAFAYGLARMYATYRALEPRSHKELAVFRSLEEAAAWLGLGPADVPPPAG